MARAVVMVLDSFGIGAAPDADDFGDEGADTFGHILDACRAGRADRRGLRKGALKLPNLERLGLLAAAGRGESLLRPHGIWGSAQEISRGKDTPSGHWEIACVPVLFEWGYFPHTVPTFPPELIRQIVADTGIPGILGDKHASGTDIIGELGEESVSTGKPIFYTSSDSVLQIAAHEAHFGLEKLYDLCTVARRHVDTLNIGRVIARPFTGASAGTFKRTANRRDYSVPPPQPTLLERTVDAGHRVHAIGKTADIFAHRGISTVLKGDGNMAQFDRMLEALAEAEHGDLVFANFVDFDMMFGHRRDVSGYAAALEAFDARLPELEAAMKPGDIAIVTADHGCDPTFAGSDHTREIVPVLAFGPDIEPKSIGRRETFADIGASVAVHLGLEAGEHGRSFL